MDDSAGDPAKQWPVSDARGELAIDVNNGRETHKNGGDHAGPLRERNWNFLAEASVGKGQNPQFQSDKRAAKCDATGTVKLSDLLRPSE